MSDQEFLEKQKKALEKEKKKEREGDMTAPAADDHGT